MDDMPYTHPDGIHPLDDAHKANLDGEGYQKCKNQLCDFMIHPDVTASLHDSGGSKAEYTCPHCGHDQQPLLAPNLGGSTATGMKPDEQGQIGENLVQALGQLPGYGQIIWWHGTEANDQSPIDGIVPNWGVEVKTTSMNTERIRGNIQPRDKPSKLRVINSFDSWVQERQDPDLTAILAEHPEMKGLLGVLVVLDVTTSTASIWVHEMPKDEGPMVAAQIKHPTRKVLVKDNVPFEHSLPDTRSPTHVPFHQQAKDELPF